MTCLCDAFFGEVGIAAARVLEHAGCEVLFPPAQTCCGQPPFNSGDWNSARPIAKRCLDVFKGDDPVVTPSASCAAMLRDGYPMLGLTAPKTFELAEFLINVLKVDRWPMKDSVTKHPTPNTHHPKAIAFHRACHGRMLGLGDVQERLLCLVEGMQLIAFAQGEQCCGFGGAFSATHDFLSSQIGLEKLRCVVESGADTLVSGDMGCLMHLNGLISRDKIPLRTAHYAQILAEALD